MQKKLSRTNLVSILFSIFLVLSLISCSPGLSKEEIENTIKNQATEQIHKNFPSINVDSVIVVKKTSNTYAGVITFSDGEKQPITVTIDGSQFVWEAAR